MKMLAVSLLATTAFAFPAFAGEVKPGESIQAEINRVAKAGGGTVSVRAGTYKESIYFEGSNVKLISADGVGAAKIVSGGTGIYAHGGSGNEIRGFEIQAGASGNGIQVGGTVRNFASDYVVADNIIKTAGEDGIKVHQAEGFSIEGNTIEKSGVKPGNSNRDGGIDFVAVQNTKLTGNSVLASGGDTCLMIKGGSSRNSISGNKLTGCKDSVHVGGLTDDQFEAPGSKGNQAFDNVITGNQLCGSNGLILFGAEDGQKDNSLSDNSCSGRAAGPTMTGYSSGYQSEEGGRFQQSITDTASKGYDAPAIVEGFAINGWSIQEPTVNAIVDGTMTGQEALDAGLIVELASPDDTGAGPTQYTGTAQYGGGSSYTGGSISMSSIPGMACGGGQTASAAAGAAGSIWSWFTGGRATALLQVAQQVQLYTANACLFSQLQAQLRSLWTQMENLKSTDLSTINGTLGSLYQVRSLLGSVDGSTYTINRVTGMMRHHYPETYDGMTTDEEVMNQTIIWENAAKEATEESWRIQSAIVKHQKQVEERTAGQVAALNKAPGMLAAQQATGNLITTLIEKAANMETASIAHYRVMEHQALQDETARQNAEELHKRRSASWGYMGETEVFQPFTN
jgi:P-type conjugative transfer protein TrbJ